jgi:outer membrane protein assembly factor BamB
MTRWLGALVVSVVSCLAANAEEWPRFRGPTGQGVSQEKALPTKWSATDNIAWKTRIPGEGWSSPIIWGDRVFLTTATDGGESCHVLALSRTDGKLLWDAAVFRQTKGHKQRKNSYATPTPITDGECVYGVFNDGGIVALTVQGQRVWVNQDVKHYSEHGLGASPITYQDMLIVSFDGSSSGPDKTVGWQKPWDKSFLLALDKKTGKERWRAKRGLSRIAHTTPIVVIADGREELISSAGDVIQGFDPRTGQRLWSVKAEGEGVVPSPVQGEGLVFAASGFGKPRLRAVKLAKEGDDKTRKIVWEMKSNVPMMASALYVKPFVFTVSENGIAVCLKAATGEVMWQERLEGSYSASPVYADGRVYFLSESGQTTVVKADAKFQVIARNSLNEPCQASLGVSRGQLFVRTARHLFCIGRK